MQLIVTHKLDTPLVLPLNYNHILQSVIYNAMKSDYDLGGIIHNQGVFDGNKRYRLFTFSLLKGKYRVKDKQIYFFDEVSFEIRSTETLLLRAIVSNFRENGISYQGQIYRIDELIVRDDTVEKSELLIRMRTPICVHDSYAADGVHKTCFYSPQEEEFSRKVNDNFINKYKVYTQVVPEYGIELVPIVVSDKDKFVTKYKGTYITGWRGIYKLSGERKYLDFLYQVGIGTKNAQGFGMFDIVEN